MRRKPSFLPLEDREQVQETFRLLGSRNRTESCGR
jgi:hypothetical protein